MPVDTGDVDSVAWLCSSSQSKHLVLRNIWVIACIDMSSGFWRLGRGSPAVIVNLHFQRQLNLDSPGRQWVLPLSVLVTKEEDPPWMWVAFHGMGASMKQKVKGRYGVKGQPSFLWPPWCRLSHCIMLPMQGQCGPSRLCNKPLSCPPLSCLR